MSKSLTVRLTLRRSSARSAPISYTPPVNPPPPSTSAVRERRPRLCGFLLETRFWAARPFGVASSSTTSPTAELYTRQEGRDRRIVTVCRVRCRLAGRGVTYAAVAAGPGQKGGDLDVPWRTHRTRRVLHRDLRSRAARVGRSRPGAAARLPGALRAVGAPAVADAGPGLQPRPGGLVGI